MKPSGRQRAGAIYWTKLSINNLSNVNTAIPVKSLNTALFRECSAISAKTAAVNLPITILYPK
jgi:hypothetical protein